MKRLLKLNEELKFNISNHNRNVVVAICMAEIKKLLDYCWFVEDYMILSKLYSALEIQILSKIPMKLQFDDLPTHKLKMVKVADEPMVLETNLNPGYMEIDGHGDISTENDKSLFTYRFKPIDAEPNDVFETESKEKPKKFMWQRGSCWLLENGVRIHLADGYPFYFDNTPDKRMNCILTTKYI